MSDPDTDLDEREAVYQYCWQRNQLAARFMRLQILREKPKWLSFRSSMINQQGSCRGCAS